MHTRASGSGSSAARPPPGSTRHVWLPKGTKSAQKSSWVQKEVDGPLIPDRSPDIMAPYYATNACRANGQWFKLEAMESGSLVFTSKVDDVPPLPQIQKQEKRQRSKMLAAAREVAMNQEALVNQELVLHAASADDFSEAELVDSVCAPLSTVQARHPHDQPSHASAQASESRSMQCRAQSPAQRELYINVYLPESFDASIILAEAVPYKSKVQTGAQFPLVQVAPCHWRNAEPIRVGVSGCMYTFLLKTARRVGLGSVGSIGVPTMFGYYDTTREVGLLRHLHLPSTGGQMFHGFVLDVNHEAAKAPSVPISQRAEALFESQFMLESQDLLSAGFDALVDAAQDAMKIETGLSYSYGYDYVDGYSCRPIQIDLSAPVQRLLDAVSLTPVELQVLLTILGRK